MKIEQFIALSEGEWKSMRSGHSLAFQQFEEVLSLIKIEQVNIEDENIKNLLIANRFKDNLNEKKLPFKIMWESESDWNSDKSQTFSKGTCYLLAIPKSKEEGFLIRSKGYTEDIFTISNYRFLDDGTFLLKTKYNQTKIEERIWFASNNVRCRSSITYSSDEKAILQTSYSSEIRRLKI